MIDGAHAIVYSKDPEADRRFLRDVLRLPHVDVGGGWLVFGLPPAEVAVHPAEDNGRHELYFLVADVDDFIAQMRKAKVACSPVHVERWGRITNVTLPGGGTIGVYQPLHERAPRMTAARPRARPTARRVTSVRRRRSTSRPKRRRT